MMKTLVVLAVYLFAVVSIGFYAYDQGRYSGMRDMCKDVVAIDSRTNEFVCVTQQYLNEQKKAGVPAYSTNFSVNING